MFDEPGSVMLKPYATASGVCLKCSCSFPTKCLAHAWTPVLWMPRIESANNLPVRYGSGLNPSQLRPPSGDYCIGLSVHELSLKIGTLKYPSNAACNGSKLDSDALVTALFAHCLAALIRQTLVPGRAHINAGWEDGDKTSQYQQGGHCYA